MLNHAFMTDMKYGREPHGGQFRLVVGHVLPADGAARHPDHVLAIIGFIACVVRRHLNGAALGVIAPAPSPPSTFAQDSLPVIGLLWNPRLLPFLYLVRYLLMMVGAVELLGLAWQPDRGRRRAGDRPSGPAPRSARRARRADRPRVDVPGAAGRQARGSKAASKAVYTWGPLTATDADAQGDGWSRYNFMGYEGRRSTPSTTTWCRR